MYYLVRKIIILLITLFLISLLTFCAFHIIPGDPAQLILGTTASPEKLEALRSQLGTNLPLAQQYRNWMAGFFRGDFGTSIRYSMPVKSLLAGNVTVTLLLGLMVIALTLAVSIPLGIFMAKKRNTLTEKLLDILNVLGLSVPGFFLSILLMWVFGLVLHLFTPGAYVSYTESVSGFLGYMIFPAVAIAIPEIATLTRYVQTAMVQELDQDYIRTARGKGAGTRRILYRHALRNALVSVIPLIGMIVGSILSGSIIVEQVFSVPGIGRLLISSVTARDFPLTQTLVIYIATIIVLTNFVVDLLIQVIDPRIRLS